MEEWRSGDSELEALKQEMNKLKVETSRTMEEKRIAESETKASLSKTELCLSSIENLSREIEEINEEQVLVELAKIEAVKEHEEIKAQRRKEAAKYSAAIGEARKKTLKMVQQMKGTKGMQQKLAAALSDISMLQNELVEIRGMQQFGGLESESKLMLEAVKQEIEAAKKQLAAIEKEKSKHMASINSLRDELNKIRDERTRVKKKEAKAEMMIQNLNSKLLSENFRLEAMSASQAKTNSVLSNLLLSHGHLKSKAEAANDESSRMRAETTSIREEIQRIETEVELGEEILQFALQELQGVKLSEAKALDDLEALTKKAVRRRTSIYRPTITISMFEYEYLKGQASEALAIADQKVAAGQAWAEAVRTSEREIQLKAESLCKEIKHLRVEKECEDQEPQESTKTNKAVAKELAKLRERIETEKTKLRAAFPSKDVNRSIKMIPRQGKGKRAISFTVARRAKVMPGLEKFLRVRSVPRRL